MRAGVHRATTAASTGCRSIDPAKAPDIINNSWGCPSSEGCSDPAILQTVLQNVTAAGILTVHSAGNEGSWQGGSLVCSTILTPAGIYAESFTVANTDITDSLNPKTPKPQNPKTPDA